MTFGSLANLCRAGMAIIDIIMKLYVVRVGFWKSRDLWTLLQLAARQLTYSVVSLRVRPSDL